MHNKYLAWIEEHCTGDTAGQCAEKTLTMLLAFPELRRVRGHYECYITGKSHPHWWLESPEGNVVDPTCDQFPSAGNGDYIEHTGPEPTGKCPNCGGYCYDNSYCCSDVCADAYARYCLNPL